MTRALLLLLLALTGPALAAPAVVTLSDGRNILLIAPAAPAKAVVVMFPGADGSIGIEPDGSIARPNNFLIRTSELWLARGLYFVAVDAAPGFVRSNGNRVGPAAQQAVTETIQAIRARTLAPIWLLGTSAGAPAALAGAVSQPPGSIRGVAISSPVYTSPRRDGVYDVDLKRVRGPVLIQIHRDDACAFTAPSNAPELKAALTAAGPVDILTYSGGDRPRSGPCEARAQYGFFGIEATVVNAAADWILSH